MQYIPTFYRKNKPAIATFGITLICYLFYLYFRGFGWDGDSFISASQFQKLLGSDLYGLLDGAAHPKILSIIVFGIIYQITGGFHFLTIISILLNTFMVSTIVKWIDRENGVWIIALVGFLINIPWTKIIINCDNPAFSMPLIIFGLYFISHNKYLKGTTFLFLSSLFRSGSEFIIFYLLINAFIHKDFKKTSVFLMFFILSSIHTYWAYLIIYPDYEYFYRITWQYLTTNESVVEYKHSLIAFVPYFNSILNQLSYKYYILFIIPFIMGLVNIFKRSNSIKFVLLTPISSIILPIGTFIYGIAHRIYQTKHMGITFILSIISAFSIDRSVIDKINTRLKLFLTIIIFIVLILLNIGSGILKNGDYETHINGTGVLGWTNLLDIKKDIELSFQDEKVNILTAYKYLTFTYLDLGKYAHNIDILKTQKDMVLYNITDYDVIILPNEWKINKIDMKFPNFEKTSNTNYSYYIKNVE